MPNIVIITFAPHGTLGDASSTVKLLREIKRASNDAWQPQITWLLAIDKIDQHRSLYLNFIADAQQLGVQVNADVPFFDRHKQVKTLSELHQKPDLLIFFSSFEALYTLRDYAAENGILTLFAPEYDATYCYGHAVLATGLAEHSTGVFIEPNTSLATLGVLQARELQLSIALGLCKATQTHILQDDLDAYRNANQLFVAYFNKDPRVLNQQVNFEAYFFIALHIALQTTAKNVHFVTNTADNNKLVDFFLQHEELHARFSKVCFVTQHGQTSVILNEDPALPEIKIFNFFPLQPAFFSFLIGIAEPFLGVTGNETLTEGIAAGGLLFYQMMFWRSKLANGLLHRARQYVGQEAVLSNYYAMLIKQTVELVDLKQLAHFVSSNFDRLVVQSRYLSRQLTQEHNLVNSLGSKLKSLMQDPSRMPELFPSCLEDRGFKPRWVYDYVKAHYPNVRHLTPNNRVLSQPELDNIYKDVIKLDDDIAFKVLEFAANLDNDQENLVFEISRDPLTGIPGFYCFQPPFSDWDDMGQDSCAVYVRKEIIDQKLYEQTRARQRLTA